MSEGIADAFISAVTKMMTQWLLFEALGIGESGGKKGSFSTSWIGSLIGGLTKSIGFFQGGTDYVLGRASPCFIKVSGSSGK